MFAKIFIKEWRENILIFFLAILMMAAMVILNLTRQQEMTLYTSGMFLLLFLPLAAMLIGSGGFYTELKDKAWIYLFSRPIKKETLWIFKYVSQLSVLAAIFVFFYLIRSVLPGLDKIFQDLDINYPDIFSLKFTLSVYVVFPIIAFTVAFSLSFLHDKQFIIFLVSILIGTGFLLVSQYYLYFLWEKGFFSRGEGILSVFFALSFVFASVLTLAKSDFSQTKKKVLLFIKYLLIFLIISFFLSTIWVTRSQIFSASRNFSPWMSEKYEGCMYFQDYRHGILRYDPKMEKVERLNKMSKFSPEHFSVRAGKIAYMQIQSRRKQWTPDLWMMNTDGSDARPLVETSKPESPFYRKAVESFILSGEGNRIAFVTTHEEKQGWNKIISIHTLWWMNTDGSGLKNNILEVPMGKQAKLIAWPQAKDFVVLVIMNRIYSRERSRIIAFDLVNGESKVLAENVIGQYVWHLHPYQEYMTFKVRDYDEGKDNLVLVNFNTSEAIPLFEKEKLRIWGRRWSPDGKKIALSSENELSIYDLEEKTFEIISKRNYEYEIGFDWTSDGQKFMLLSPIDGEYHLVVMSINFQEEKKIRVPVPIKRGMYVWGLEGQSLLKSTDKGALWRVDLDTEEWKKVY
jgi:hypothetical protein